MTLRLLEEPKLRLLAEKVSKGVMGLGKATLQAPIKAVEPLAPAFKQAKPYLPLIGEKYEGVITKARKRAFGVESFEEPLKKAPDWTMFVVPPLTPFIKEEAKFRKGLIGTTADIYTRPDVLLGAVARGVKPLTQARGLARLEKATPLFEKSGVKFPQGWSARRKAVEILNRAQVDPKVGDVVQKIISPQYVYGGGPSTKQITQLAKQFNIPIARLETAIKTGSYTGLPVQAVSAIKALQPTPSKGGEIPTKPISPLKPSITAPKAGEVAPSMPQAEIPRLLQEKSTPEQKLLPKFGTEGEGFTIYRTPSEIRAMKQSPALKAQQEAEKARVTEEKRITKLQQETEKLGEFLAKSPTKIKPTIHKVTGVKKVQNIISLDERLLLNAQIRIEARAAKTGWTEGAKNARAILQSRIEAKRELNKMISDIKKIDVARMSPQEAEPIKKLINNLDLVKRQKPTMLELGRTRQYLEANPETEMPDYMMEKLSRLDKRNLNDIDVDELRTIHDSVMHYVKLNQTKNQIKVGREIRQAKQVLNNSIGEMKSPPKVRSDIVESQKSKIGRIKDTGRLIKDTFGIRHDHYDLVVETLAGPNSTMDNVLYQGVKEGVINELSYKQEAFNTFQKDVNLPEFMKKYNIKDIASWQNERVPIGKFNLTKGERMSLYRHSLNNSNSRHILEGGFGLKHSENPKRIYKMTEKELNDILESLTPAEREFSGQPVTNLFDNQHQALDKVFYDKNGYPLPKENNYYPIEVMKTTLPRELEAESILEELKHKWVRIGLKKGMLENRTKSRLPIYLNEIAYDINKSIMNSAAYIGLEIPLSNASKLLYNKTFRAEISNRYGNQTWQEIEKGLRDIAGDWQSYSTVEELAMQIKNKLSTAILGINPFVMAKQILSFPLYNIYVKPEYLIQGLVDYTFHRSEVIARHKMYSPEYTERIEGGYSRDVADVFKSGATERLYKGKKSIPEKLMGGVKLFDEGAVNPGMQGAVLQVLDEFKKGTLSSEVKMALNITDIAGLTPEDKMKLAYKFADYATERTQPMFSPEHRSSLSRGSAIEKLATQFSSFTNQALNLIRRVAREAHRTKDPQQYAKLLKTLFYLLVVNTAGVYAIDSLRDILYKRKRRGFGEAILDSVSSYFYFIRDLEKSIVSKVKYGTFRGYDISIPILSASNDFANMISDGIGMVTDDTQDKRSKRTKKFIDEAIGLLLLSQGIPYRTPKKLITAPFKKEPTVTKGFQRQPYQRQEFKRQPYQRQELRLLR